MSWQIDALCRQPGVDRSSTVFGTVEQQKRAAKTMCARCPVREVCLWTAMLQEHGTCGQCRRRWFLNGGMTAAERADLAGRGLSVEAIKRCYLAAFEAWETGEGAGSGAHSIDSSGRVEVGQVGPCIG